MAHVKSFKEFINETVYPVPNVSAETELPDSEFPKFKQWVVSKYVPDVVMKMRFKVVGLSSYELANMYLPKIKKTNNYEEIIREIREMVLPDNRPERSEEKWGDIWADIVDQYKNQSK